MRSRGEGERGRDDLAPGRKAERLEDALERRVPIGKERYVLHPKVGPQPLLELGVLGAHVREPVALPERGHLLEVLPHARHGGPSDQDAVGHPNPPIRLSRSVSFSACVLSSRPPSGQQVAGGGDEVRELLQAESRCEAEINGDVNN